MPPRPAVDPRTIPRPVEPEFDPEMPPAIHPGDEVFHPYLRFSRAEDRTARDHLLRLVTRHGYFAQRYMVWECLRAISLHGPALSLCGTHWRRLFSITEATCRELAIEFFSTIHLVTPLTDYEREDALTFRLGGEERRLSLRQFAVFMGLYMEDELDTPAFTDGITSWPEGMTAYEFWCEVGEGNYTTPTLQKSTKLIHPLHRIIHRDIVHSIAARTDTSSGSVSQVDLLYLYCMIHSQPCQIAERLAQFLFSMRRPRANQGIFGGGYVTHLARRMAIIPEEDPEDLTFLPAAVPINRTMLIRMGVVRQDDTRLVLLDGRGQPWVPPREGDRGHASEVHEDAGDAGAGPSGTSPVQEPVQTQIPHPSAPVPPPSHQSPPRQSHVSDSTIVFSRQRRIERLEDEVSSLRSVVSGLQATVAESLEMQRLEYAHAEACRVHSFRIMQLMASGSAGPFPDPPSPPQRLRDFYARAGTSGSHQQPPPP